MSISAANGALDAKDTVILDATALSTLYVTEAHKCLEDIQLNLVVTSGTLLEFRRLLLDKSRSARDGGFSTTDCDRYVFHKRRGDGVVRDLARLERFLRKIQEVAEVCDALPRLRAPRSRRYALSEVLGQPSAGTMTLAQETGYVLWTDHEIARGDARPFLCEAAAFRLLDHVDQRRDGRKIIRGMYDEAGQICHMELQRSIVPAFRNLIEGWRASRGI